MAGSRLYRVALLLLGLLPSLAVGANQALILEEAVRMAYDHNPNLLAARTQLEAVSRETGLAIANFLPRLDLEQTYVSTNQQVAAFGTTLNQGAITQADFDPRLLNDPDRATDHGTSVILSQPIFNGGREILGYKMARRAQAQAAAGTSAAVEGILYQTVKAYTDAVLAREAELVSTDALRTGERNLDMIQRLFAEGMIIKSDLLQAQVHVAELRERLASARNGYRLALVALNTMLGDPGGGKHPAEGFSGGSCPAVELETLIGWALEDRSELRALEQQEAMAWLSRRLAQAGFLPNLNARASYDYHGQGLLADGTDSYTIALSLRWNLFNGTADHKREQQAAMQLDAVRTMRRAREDMIALEVTEAWSNLQTAEERLGTMREAVDQAAEGLRILEQRYEQGAAGIVDLLNAEMGLAGARLRRLQAEHDLLLGNAALCKSVGHLATRWLAPENCPVPPMSMEKEDDHE
ncbi:TolC family protein [bacterium]|nr:TolC family protein [candidate division CSSED10-310 bacterium]